jgi:dTDP-4-dehydrorhamnose reductase
VKIFLAGVGGMLGQGLHRVLSGKHELYCTDLNAHKPWLHKSDFRDFTDYEHHVSSFEPDILMHIGAHTSLEYCEDHPDDAYRTNTLAVEHAATLAQAHQIPLVYISTAGIFDGGKDLYDDWDTPNPLGVYARTKYLGEHIVQTRVQKHYIFRAGWMMGGGPDLDKKFINKLLKQLATGTKTLKVVNDKLGTPTYTVDFARNLEAVISTPFVGVYNMVCGGETCRLEVATELVRLLGLSDSVTVEAVSSDYFASEYFAPRPGCERLTNYKLKLLSMDQMRHWRVALEDYLSDYFADYVKPFAPAFVATKSEVAN